MPVQIKHTSKPVRRSAGLLIKPLDREILVYDLTAHRATCLNEFAATIWDLCDGTRDLAALVRDGGADDDVMVRHALEKLAAAELLANTPPNKLPADRGGMQVDAGRRHALKQLAAGAVVAAPLVTTLTVPTAAQAASCAGFGGACSFNSDCCTGLECGGGRCGPAR